MFQFDYLERQKLERVTDPKTGKRVYNTPVGPLSSVTTILSERIPAPYLAKWKAEVGDEEAARISDVASRRGKACHDALEKYLINENWRQGLMPVHVNTILPILPILDKGIGMIYGIEFPLWSRHLKAAGTADLICRFDNEISVLDFKTSKRIKNLEDIESYFIQTCAYSIMLQELYNMSADQLIILMMIDNEPPKLFVERRYKYLDRTIDIFRGKND
jgi:hypothetical protein